MEAREQPIGRTASLLRSHNSSQTPVSGFEGIVCAVPAVVFASYAVRRDRRLPPIGARLRRVFRGRAIEVDGAGRWFYL